MGEIIGWGWWEKIRQITTRFKKTIYKLSLTSMATENVLFLHCSQHVFERHSHTLSREISLLFF